MPTTYAPGSYTGEVLEQGFAESPAKGTPYFFVHVRLKHRRGEKGLPQPCARYERTLHLYLNTETGIRILREDLRSLGVEITDLTQLDPDSPDPISLVGREIPVECQHEDYAGQTRERWRIARPTRKRMSRDAIRALNSGFAAGTALTPPPAPPAEES